MRFLNGKLLNLDAVQQTKKAEFEASPEEIDELQAALKVMEKWKVAARKGLKIKEKNADWTMYQFGLLRHDGRVTVRVDQGACG